MTPQAGWKYVSYEIALLAGATQGQYNFLINNYLVDQPIHCVTVYTSNDISYSPTSSANVVWTPAQVLDSCITFYCFDPLNPSSGAKAEWIKDMPVNSLHTQFNTNAAGSGSSVYARTMFNGICIDWNKSYIRFIQNVTLSVNTSALFGVYYG